MAAQPVVAQSEDWVNLRQSVVLKAAIAFAFVAVYAWSEQVSRPFADGNLVMLALVCAALCLGGSLSRRLPGSAAAIIVVLLPAIAAYAAYAWLGYQAAWLFMAVPAMLAAFVLRPLWGLVVSLFVATAMSLTPGLAPGLLWPARLLVVFLGGLATLVAHDWRQSLEHAWRYADVGASLMREVRARQEEVNRLNKALTVSNGLLRRSLDELALAQREMAEARHLKEQFATTVSHELRTPLSIILGFVDVMQHYPEVYGEVNWTPRLRRDLGEIQHSARYLSSLVDDILDLARIQALKMPVHREQTDLARLVEEVVELAGRLLLDKPSVRITHSLPPGLPSLYLDPVRIRQVLLNLLANACRFTSQGEIRVAVSQGPNEVVVSVSDTGPGIPPDQLQTIFEEFRQGSSPALDEQAHAGKGLGLAIAKHFVHMHGGRIWAESCSDPALGPTGSTFHFSLPLLEKQIVPLAAPPLHATTAAKPQPSVILVDRADGQRLLARHLDGYQVLAAPDVAEARHLVRQFHPQAVIVNVPPEAHDATHGTPPLILPEPLPVLQCSLPVGRWFLEPGLFDEWLVKPIDVSKLAEAIGKHADARSILVVDDDRSFMRLIRRFLEARFSGCEVIACYSGDEALEALAGRTVDVALLDIGLPGSDGRVLARAIRQLHPGHKLTVIAVTALQPGLEGEAASPRSFSVTSSRGFSEAESLGLIRACLSLLQPSYASEGPAQGRAAEPAGQPAS